MMPQVTYAVNGDFAITGTGFTASNGCRALHNAGMLKTVLCRSHKPTDIPEQKIVDVFPGGRKVARAITGIAHYGGGIFPSQYVNDVIYDNALVKHVRNCDVFSAWNMPLKAQRAAQRQGIITIKEAGSTHPLTRKEIFAAEAARRNVRIAQTPQVMVARELQELQIVDHTVVPSTFCKESYVKNGIDTSRVHVVHNGVDIARFTPTAMPGGRFTAFFCGQVQHRKGVMDLLEAWKSAALPDATLVLGGTVFPEMRKTIREYQRTMDIMTPGFVDPAAYLKDAHMFVFPSLEDGFGLVVTEAMACGRPVLISKNTGAKDFVHEGKDGFVVPAGDAAAIAKRLRFAYDNRQHLAVMGRAARKSVQGYSWHEYGQCIVKTYKKCARLA